MGDVIPGRYGPENFMILKRRELRFDRLSERFSFSDLIRLDQFGARPAEMSYQQDAPGVEGSGVSIVQLALVPMICVSLTLCRQGIKAERNKSVRIRNDGVYLWITIIIDIIISIRHLPLLLKFSNLIFFYTFAVFDLVWFGLVCWFYGISTIVGYLTPNPFLCK